MYKTFMEAVDAIDNGVNQYDTEAPARYIDNTSLASRVKRLNPEWNQESSNALLDQQFLKAVALAGSELAEAVQVSPEPFTKTDFRIQKLVFDLGHLTRPAVQFLQYTALVWLPARGHVKEALLQVCYVGHASACVGSAPQAAPLLLLIFALPHRHASCRAAQRLAAPPAAARGGRQRRRHPAEYFLPLEGAPVPAGGGAQGALLVVVDHTITATLYMPHV